jgi:hypothetical protein
MSPVSVKDWRNATAHDGGGDTSTPLSAVALEDLESRMGAYTDLKTMVSVKEYPYSATGDGTTDDTTAVQGALTTGNPVFFPDGAYRITSALTVTAPVMGAGKDNTILIQDFSSDAVLKAVGTGAGSSVNVTVAVTAGQNTLTISSTTGIVAGDYLLLKSALGWPNATIGAVTGEIVRVKTVDSATVVTLWGPVDESYALVNSPTVEELTFLRGVTFSNFTIRNSSPGTRATGSNGIVAQNTDGVIVSKCGFQQLDQAAINLHRSVNWIVEGCEFRDLAGGIVDSSLLGYGVTTRNGARDGLVANCTSRAGRHFFTTSASSGQIPPRHILVSSCVATGSEASAFDSHEEGRFITYQGCRAQSSQATGFNVRAPDVHILDCIVNGCSRGGAITSAALRCLVSGGRVERVRDQGIGTDRVGWLVQGAGTEIRNHQILTTAYEAIRLDASDCRVANVRIDSPGTTSNSYGVRAISGTGSRITWVDITNATDGVRAEGAGTIISWIEGIHGTSVTNLINEATSGVVVRLQVAASAATITLPVASVPETVAVTGSTGITSINATLSDTGRIVTLLFTGTLTVTDGSNLKLSANFSATPADCLTLLCDGTDWYEVARSNN